MAVEGIHQTCRLRALNNPDKKGARGISGAWQYHQQALLSTARDRLPNQPMQVNQEGKKGKGEGGRQISSIVAMTYMPLRKAAAPERPSVLCSGEYTSCASRRLASPGGIRSRHTWQRWSDSSSLGSEGPPRSFNCCRRRSRRRSGHCPWKRTSFGLGGYWLVMSTPARPR